MGVFLFQNIHAIIASFIASLFIAACFLSSLDSHIFKCSMTNIEVEDEYVISLNNPESFILKLVLGYEPTLCMKQWLIKETKTKASRS